MELSMLTMTETQLVKLVVMEKKRQKFSFHLKGAALFRSVRYIKISFVLTHNFS